MKAKKYIITLIVFVGAVVIAVLFGYKTYAIEDNGDTLLYSNSIYKQIPYDFQFGQNRHLLPNDRIDITKVLTNKEQTYVLPKTYYVYKGDNFNSPNVIYKQNNSFGTSGWLYIKDGFNYALTNVETHKIIEVFVEHVDIWSTEDPIVIERIKTAIINSEDLISVISEYTDIEWYRLYIRYENSPFVHEIGRQKNGKFQYNN